MSLASKVQQWGCCTNNNEGTDHIVCAECGFAFHLDCMGTAKPDSEDTIWKCTICTGKKTYAENTLIRKPTATSGYNEENVTTRSTKRPAISSPIEERSPVTRDEVGEIVREVFKSEMGTLISQMNNNFAALMSREIKGLKTEITDLKDCLNFMSLQYEHFKEQHESTTKHMVELQTENANMRSTITQLNNRVDQLEQQARANNVALQCIPEKKSENLHNIVTSICNVVSCAIKPENIVKCTRIAKIDPSGSRPRSIVVQLSSSNIRDQFPAAVKTYNKSKRTIEEKLNTGDIGFGCNKSPVCVIEHLTPSNKALHAAARLRAKEKKYKFVWIRNGKIFVRKSDDTDYIMIRDRESLNKIV